MAFAASGSILTLAILTRGIFNQSANPSARPSSVNPVLCKRWSTRAIPFWRVSARHFLISLRSGMTLCRDIVGSVLAVIHSHWATTLWGGLSGGRALHCVVFYFMLWVPLT